ncbi:MAG: lipase maturation factor family protein [Opitutaceae bacterium]
MPARVWRNVREFLALTGDTTLLWPRWMLLRAIGVLYIFAFAGIMAEGQALIGPAGVLPLAKYFAAAEKLFPGSLNSLLHTPSLFWLGNGAGAVTAVAWLGLVAAIALVLNFWPRMSLFVCWACFLSFIASWAEFSPAQLDGLLLEAAVLCIPFAPRGLRPGLGARHPPRPLTVFMLRWMLLRVMLLSGVVKLISDDPHWRNLTAMDLMAETSPSPTVIGYWLHQLPHAYHVFEIALTFAAELLAPLLAVLGGRRGRWLAFGLWTLLQVGIQLTANFGWLNAAAFGLGLLLLDDAMIAAAVRRLRLTPLRALSAAPFRPPAEAISPWRLHGLRAALGVHFALTLYYIAEACGVPVENAPAVISKPVGVFEGFRSANGYRLFAYLSVAHFQIDFEGSNDGGRTWRTYPLRHLPQMPEHRPEFTAPYSPRFDSTLHAESTAEPRPSVVTQTAAQLLARKAAVMALFERDPFKDRPPTVVRMRRYRLIFTDPATLRRTGHYWIKEYAGDYQPAMFLDERGIIAQFDLGAADAALAGGNPAAALREYERQYQLGNLEAGLQMAYAYAAARGVPAQAEKVFALFSDLAGSGELKAMHSVGLCYEKGIGVAPDAAKASEFYRRAAEGGNFISLHSVGLLAAEDRLVPRDDALGLASLAIAADRATGDAATTAFVRENEPALVSRLKARISAADLEKARALAAARRAALP